MTAVSAYLVIAIVGRWHVIVAGHGRRLGRVDRDEETRPRPAPPPPVGVQLP